MNNISRRQVLRLGTALAVTAIGVGSATATTLAIRDRDCSDFRTQKQAQRFFKKHGGSRHNDPFGLDSDHDGKACESLPRR